MPDSSDYSALAQLAEKAVAAVEDPELKKIAFQTILVDLLGGNAASPTGRARPPSKKAIAPRAASNSKKVKTGTAAYLDDLVGEGFFDKPKAIAEVKTELENQGHHIPTTSLSGPLQSLCKAKTLRRRKNDRKLYEYSNY